MAKNIIDIFVGAPENDKEVSISTNKTVAEVLKEAEVDRQGTIQHNGKILSSSELGQTLETLGFVTGDSLFVVKKMDSAQ